MPDFILNDKIISNIDTVLLDKDSTFIEADEYWGKIAELRVKQIIERYNLDSSIFYDLCREMGYDAKNKKLVINGAIGVLSRNGVIETVLASLNKRNITADFYDISKIFDFVHDSFTDDIKSYTNLIPGALNFIKKMYKYNIKIAVVTSDTHKNTEEILKHLGISAYFDLIIGKDDCINEKKSGEPAKLALKLLNSKAENTISIGDAQMDYLMAKNAGLKSSILVATGLVPKSELLNLTDYTVNNLSEIEIVSG